MNEVTEEEALETAIAATRQIADSRDAIQRRRVALKALVDYGWSYQRIADALGVTKSAIAATLKDKTP